MKSVVEVLIALIRIPFLSPAPVRVSLEISPTR